MEYNDAYKRFATKAINARGHFATTVYDDRTGAATSSTDANNLTSTAKFDYLGRKIVSYSPLGVSSTTTYAAGSGSVSGAVMSITSTVSGSGPTTSHVDLLGREIQRDAISFDGSVVSVRTNYDARGRKTNSTRPYFNLSGPGVGSSFEYEAEQDRLIKEIAPDGGVTLYNTLGFTSTVSRNTKAYATTSDTASAQASSRTTNSQGWTISSTDALNQTTTFSHDALGNLFTVTKPGGQQVSMLYDLRGRKTRLTDPDAGTTDYTYNAAGELITETVATVGTNIGRTSTSAYDNLGRLVSRVETAEGRTYTTTNTYDCANSIGKLCTDSLTQPASPALSLSNTVTNTRSITRDSLSRTVTSTTVLSAPRSSTETATKTLTSRVTYDDLSRVKTTTYPLTGLTLNTNYNAHGYQSSVTETLTNGATRTHWQANTRHPDGQINTHLVGALTTTKTIDSVGRTLGIVTGNVQYGTAEWDAIGNLTRRIDPATTVLNGTPTTAQADEYFCYDKLNRKSHSINGVINGVRHQ